MSQSLTTVNGFTVWMPPDAADNESSPNRFSPICAGYFANPPGFHHVQKTEGAC
jgi:hypothetical protein